MPGVQVEVARPGLAQHHVQFEPGCAGRKLQVLKAAEGHEHELLAEGEVFQQQLVATEGAVALWPQAVLVGKALGYEMPFQRLAHLILPRQAHVQRLGLQSQRLVQLAGQRRIGIEVQRQTAEIDQAPVRQCAAGKAQAQHRAPVRFISQAQRFQRQGLQGEVLGGGVAATGAL
ncbi:hypothetical protein D3C77_149230 [compost metagenome]